jgi:hypothetical protein
MSDSWRIATDFDTAWGHTQKRIMRQERRPAVTNATQILGPGAAPFAVLLNDWNEEAATFVGVFYSEPGAINTPDQQVSLDLPPGDYYWMGETFGMTDEEGYRWGFQHLTRYRLVPDGTLGQWARYVRRFYPQGELISYSDWEEV